MTLIQEAASLLLSSALFANLMPAPVRTQATESPVSGPSSPKPGPQDKPDTGKKDKDKKDKEAESWHREGLTFKKGQSEIVIRGYAQGDFREPDWKVRGDETGDLQAPGRELRRLRFGVEGQLGDVSFELMLDPRKSQAGSRLKDATFGYRFSKKLNLLVGHFKPPVSAEFLTGVSRTDFVDRSMFAARLAPGRDWGASLSGELGRLDYSVGAFDGDDSANEGVGISAATRLSFEVSKNLRLAVSLMQGEVTAAPRAGAAEPSPRGASGVTSTGFTFWNRPHVDGTRRRLGSDVSYVRDRLRLQAEYLEEQEERRRQGSTGQDLPDVRGRGWSAAASYVLIGERKGANAQPRKSVFRGGAGALEIVARIEALKFDDTGDPSGFAGFGNRSRNISPSGASAVQAGANFWFSGFLKLQGSAIWESYNDPLIAPVPGNKGRYFTLLGRVQFMIP